MDTNERDSTSIMLQSAATMYRLEESADEARHVYVLMKKNVALSPRARVRWYFANLNAIVRAMENEQNDDDDDVENFCVVSFLPNVNRCESSVSSDSCGAFRLVPASIISFLAHKYSFVFCLDLSTSTAVVDVHHGSVVIDEAPQVLEKCLSGLLQPFRVPGSNVVIQPQLFVTVIAQIPCHASKFHQVIVQGCCVSLENLNEFVANTNTELYATVNQLAEIVQSASHLHTTRLKGNGVVDESALSFRQSENDFVLLIRQGILATNLLPKFALAGIIVVTDGIVNVSDINSLQGLLAQLRASSISCSFLQLGTPYNPQSCFGYVPYTDLMSFIALATGGACFTSLPDVDTDASLIMNFYHRLLLTWSFQYDLNKTKVEPTVMNENLLNSWNISNGDVNLLKKKHQGSNIHTSLFNVLSCRLREGYMLRSLNVKDNNHIDVTMMLPWKSSVNLLYVISTVWRSNQPNQSCHYDVISESTYEFLRDFTYATKEGIKSLPRMAVIRQFMCLLHRLRQTDHFLYHVQSFSFNSIHYAIPEGIKNRLPLFSYSGNGSSPALYSSDFSHPAFEAYWKPICLLDVSIWQKWFHVHRLVTLLEPDHPLPKHLHLPNTSGRYQVVQCRQALAVLQALFTEWSSFILVENHSFIKFIQGEVDKAPMSFCIARIMLKAPCIVVHLAFLGGTKEDARHEIIEELKTKILALTIPHRPKVKDALVRKGIVSSAVDRSEDASGVQRFRRGSSQISCCVMLAKSLDRILIKYEKVPEEFWKSLPYSNHNYGGNLLQTALPLALSNISCYLLHNRWIWAVKKRSREADGLVSVGRILSTLVKLRLQEGFRIAYAHSGIINLVLELELKQVSSQQEKALLADDDEAYHCIIQYILFPPHMMTMNMRESISEEDVEIDMNEHDGELQLVCECWIEPQAGIVINTIPECSYLEGCTHAEIGTKIFEHDHDCISSMVTFEHLTSLCQRNIIASMDNGIVPPSGCFSSIRYVPFEFQLIELLSKFHQSELMFSTYIQVLQQDDENIAADAMNELLFNLLHEHLRKLHNQEIKLSDKDQAKFFAQILQREQDYRNVPLSANFTHRSRPAANSFDKDAPGISKSSRKMVKQTAFDANNDNVSFDAVSPVINWKCFAKGISASHVVLTFLPENFKELKNFIAKREYLGYENHGAQYFQNDIEDGCHTEEEVLEECSKPEDIAKNNGLGNDAFDLSDSDGFVHSKPIFRSLCLPIYVYNCPLANLTSQLVCKERGRGCDVSFDFTFKHRQEMLGEDTVTLRSETQSSENSKRPSPEPHCEDSNGHVEGHFNTLRKSLELVFLKSFVTGIFQNLHLRRKVHPYDVQTAIDSICSESLLEIDISSFLQIVCKHVRDFKTKIALESLCNSPICYSLSGKNLPQDSGTGEAQLEVLHVPRQKFALTSLRHSEASCVDEWHSLLKRKFSNILRKAFLPIPTCEDFFFYCPPNFQQVKPESVSGNDAEVRSHSSDGQESETFRSETVEFRSEFESTSLFSNKPVKCVYDLDHREFPASGSVIDSDSIDSLMNGSAGSSADCEDDIPPLFLHLMCTVRANNGLGSCSVQNVPSCISEITECLESSVQDIDLNDFQVTLDINCLTLPPDIEMRIGDKMVDVRTPSFSSISPVSSENHFPAEEQEFVSEDEYQAESQSDQLNHLPEFQHRAVTNAVEEIKWMLRDEIAAAMLESFPLTETTLEMVAMHVQSSSGCPGCLLEEVSLQFVFGPDQSLDKFIQEFRQMSLSRYQLRNEGKYYYLVIKGSDVKRASFGQAHFGFASKSLFIQTNPHSDDTTALRQIGSGGDQEATSDEGLRLCSDTFLRMPTKLKSIKRLAACKDAAEYDTESEDCKQSVRSGTRSRKTSHTHGEAAAHRQRTAFQCVKAEDDSTDSVPITSEKNVPDKISEPVENVCASEPQVGTSKESGDDDEVGTNVQRSNSSTNLATTDETQDAPPKERVRKIASWVNISQKQNSSATGASSDMTSLLGSGQCSNEDGYEGDSSDIENESDWLNDLEIQRPALPSFWLILQVFGNCVKVFFHTRDSDGHTNQLQQGKDVVRQVIKNVKSICKVVNQNLLLQNLHDTRMCDQLLEPEGTEDIWKSNDPVVIRRRSASSYTFHGVDDYENETYDCNHTFLKANLDFKPGTFACNVIWQKNFILHPRLKTGPGRTGVSRGIQALRTVLNAFSVNNRENMFVYAGTEGSVFYLRLKESQCSVSQMMGDLTPGSRSSSMVIIPLRKTASENEDEPIEPRPRVNSGSEHDTACDTASVTSRSSLGGRFRTEDTIQLLVHGIADAGLEITEELVKVLQNRLDEAVLDVISVHLFRNPMCKLTKDDVQFLQKPNEAPTRVFHFTIHAQALPFLQAVRVYLYQNLQQFLNIPKYIDNKTEFHFQDFAADGDAPKKDADIFLYNRPQGSGNKGIAVIMLSFVDGLGNPVQYLTCPKIPPSGERNSISSFEFDSLTSTTLYEFENSFSSRHPGPMAMIRFRIWERGKLDAEQLMDRLQSFVRHALWDVVTEYMVLVAPLVEDLPLDSAVIYSEPVTPIKGKHTSRAQQEPKTAPSISLLPQLMGSPSVPCTPYPGSFYRRDVESLDVDIDMHRLQDGSETGDHSQLVNVYSVTAKEWLEYAMKLGVPSVSKNNFVLNNRHLIPNIIKEIYSVIKTQGLDMCLKIFSHTTADQGSYYASCSVPSYPLKDIDKKQLMDALNGFKTMPGSQNNFIIVGRNFKHWRACVSYLQDESPGSMSSNAFSRPCQKFTCVYQPALHAVDRNESIVPSGGTSLSTLFSGDSESSVFVPRQTFLFITIHDKDITVYTYNWSNDAHSSFVQKITQIVEWNKERAHVLKELYLQKMGLFYSQSNFPKSSSREICGDMELMKNSSPIAREGTALGQSRPTYGSHSNAPGLRQVFRDTVAKQPFCKGEFPMTGDPITDHCSQLQELRHTINKDIKLKSLNISHNSGSLGSCIFTEENVLAVRHASRLEHYCFTPLLFLPQWRWQVAAARDHTVHSMSLLKSTETMQKSSESRHSSGGSTKSLDLKNRRQSVNLPVLPSAQNSSKILSQRICNEDIWHTPLCLAYIQEFLQYLQNLGFVSLQIKSGNSKKNFLQKEDFGEISKSSSRLASAASILKHNVHYTQKILLGGSTIILELSIVEPYFCMRVFALEGSRSFIGSSRLPPNSQFMTAFIDECDKQKNLLHLHSFTYDYHLRSIHSYISGRQLIFRQGYHLTSFLDDFVKYYQKSPNFSWNLIYHDVLTFEDLSVPGDQLYNHLLDHDKMYGMQAMRMIPVVHDAHKDTRIEFILVQLSSQKVSYKDSSDIEHTDDFDISLLISQESPSNFYMNKKNSNAFLLLYYIILTSRRELYPRITVEKKLGKFRTVMVATPIPSRKVSLTSMDKSESDKLEIPSYKTSVCSSNKSHDLEVEGESDGKEGVSLEGPSSSSLPSTPAIQIDVVRRLSTSDSESISTSFSIENQNRQLGIRQESVNYLGYFSTTEELMNKIIIEQAQAAKERIHKVLAKATVHWRRDTYWKRLFTASRVESQERGRHKDETRELVALNYEEFSDLLSLVSSQSLSSIDPRLVQLANMHISWYMGLVKLLISKYSENCCYFVEPDGSLQHVVVLNPSYNDHFMLLTVDGSNNRAKLCAIFRKCPSSADPCLQAEHPFPIHEHAVQAAIQDFVSTCCFHLWSCLL